MCYKWDNKKPTAQMLGRWQPFHDGNYALFEEIIKKAIKSKKGRKITVEVDSIKQFKKIYGLGFDRILFDNMSPKNLRAAVKYARGKYETEASGNINLKTVRTVAASGVDRISVGSITHSAAALDLKLEF